MSTAINQVESIQSDMNKNIQGFIPECQNNQQNRKFQSNQLVIEQSNNYKCGLNTIQNFEILKQNIINASDKQLINCIPQIFKQNCNEQNNKTSSSQDHSLLNFEDTLFRSSQKLNQQYIQNNEQHQNYNDESSQLSYCPKQSCLNSDITFKNDQTGSFSTLENSSQLADNTTISVSKDPLKGNNIIKHNMYITDPQNQMNSIKSNDSFLQNQQDIFQSNQQYFINESRLKRLNSILKKRNRFEEKEHNNSLQSILTTNQSYDQINSQQINSKEHLTSISLNRSLDEYQMNVNESQDAITIKNVYSTYKIQDSIKDNVEQEFIRDRCLSISPKKSVKFDQIVQVCNMQNSKKSSYNLGQKEMKKELIQKCSQLRKDLHVVRVQHQISQEKQKIMKKEQLLSHFNELLQNSQKDNEPECQQSQINKTTYINTKQYCKYKIAEKQDKNKEKEQYLKKIEQIHLQYKQNLEQKFQTINPQQYLTKNKNIQQYQLNQ